MDGGHVDDSSFGARGKDLANGLPAAEERPREVRIHDPLPLGEAQLRNGKSLSTPVTFTSAYTVPGVGDLRKGSGYRVLGADVQVERDRCSIRRL